MVVGSEVGGDIMRDKGGCQGYKNGQQNIKKFGLTWWYTINTKRDELEF